MLGNKVTITHLDKNYVPYWNNKVFAHGENIVFIWVPIMAHLKHQCVCFIV